MKAERSVVTVGTISGHKRNRVMSNAIAILITIRSDTPNAWKAGADDGPRKNERRR